jgi:hypothetical protein
VQCHANAMLATCCGSAAGLLLLLLVLVVVVVVVVVNPPAGNTVSIRADAMVASCLHTSSAWEDTNRHQHACVSSTEANMTTLFVCSATEGAVCWRLSTANSPCPCTQGQPGHAWVHATA